MPTIKNPLAHMTARKRKVARRADRARTARPASRLEQTCVAILRDSRPYTIAASVLHMEINNRGLDSSRPAVVAALKALAERGVITQEGSSSNPSYNRYTAKNPAGTRQNAGGDSDPSRRESAFRRGLQTVCRRMTIHVVTPTLPSPDGAIQWWDVTDPRFPDNAPDATIAVPVPPRGGLNIALNGRPCSFRGLPKLGKGATRTVLIEAVMSTQDRTRIGLMSDYSGIGATTPPKPSLLLLPVLAGRRCKITVDGRRVLTVPHGGKPVFH